MRSLKSEVPTINGLTILRIGLRTSDFALRIFALRASQFALRSSPFALRALVFLAG